MPIGQSGGSLAYKWRRAGAISTSTKQRQCPKQPLTNCHAFRSRILPAIVYCRAVHQTLGQNARTNLSVMAARRRRFRPMAWLIFSWISRCSKGRACDALPALAVTRLLRVQYSRKPEARSAEIGRMAASSENDFLDMVYFMITRSGEAFSHTAFP